MRGILFNLNINFEMSTMKRIFILSLVYLFSFTSYAASSYLTCSQAAPTNDPSFCPSFKSVAICHCIESGIPAGKCQSMQYIYDLMIARFKSIQEACKWQHDTDMQTCIDDWNCYRQGGQNSQGQLCSSTGSACTM